MTAIDLDAREVRFEEISPLSYDYLVLGLGAEVNFFGTEGAEEHAFPMYTLPNAVRLKDHLLERWEAAERDPSLVEDGALNVVIVGGGPTGVETAGAVAELYRADFAKDYPSLPQDEARITLVEAGPELFSMFKPKIREYTAKALTDRTVEVRTGAMVASVSPTRVTLKSGEELKAHTLVWGAGLQGNRLVQTLGLELQRGNRIAVGPDLTLPDRPEVYALGDIAAIMDEKTAAGPSPARLRRPPVRGARGRVDRSPHRGQGDEAVQVQGQGDDGGDRARCRGRADARRTDDDREEGAARVGHGAPGPPADERRPREGRRRLGGGDVLAPAGRADHGRERVAPMTLASAVDLARLQFATTSIYHFFFVPLTLGLGPLVAIMQTIWHRTGNESWLRLTRFFGTLLLINFAIGVATGLVQEFEFGMNWSVYSRFVGNVFGAPLAMEGLAAFFLEVDVPRPVDLRLESALAAPPSGDALDRRARHLAVGLLHPRRELVDAAPGRVQDRRRRGAADERLGAPVERVRASRVRAHDARGLDLRVDRDVRRLLLALPARQRGRPFPERREGGADRRGSGDAAAARGRQPLRRGGHERPEHEDRRLRGAVEHVPAVRLLGLPDRRLHGG